MTLPRSVAEILREHVTLELECIDRMYLNVYVPALQSENGVAAFFKFHRGYPVASSALMDPISKAFVAGIDAFARRQNVPVVAFKKGERKDEVVLSPCLSHRHCVTVICDGRGAISRIGRPVGARREGGAMRGRRAT